VNTIENLRTFVTVADTGSLAAAARQMGIAPSVVTTRIDQLEWRVKSRLVARSTKRVALTEHGSRYLPSARRLVHDYDEVVAEMSNSPTHIEGHIRIKVPTSMAVAFMAETLARFQRQHPQVSLDVVLKEGGDPRDDGFDIFLTGGPTSYAGFIDEPICPLYRYACAAPTYLAVRGTPYHPRELADHDCLLFSPVGRTWHFETASGPISVDLRPRLSANDHFVLTAAAVRGNGVALLPSYAAVAALRAGTLVRVLDRFAVPNVWLKAVVPEARAGIPHVSSLIVFLKTHYGPVPPWDR